MKKNALNVAELELSTERTDVILVTLALRKQNSLIVTFNNNYPSYISIQFII